jgi:hypothetical protein
MRRYAFIVAGLSTIAPLCAQAADLVVVISVRAEP